MNQNQFTNNNLDFREHLYKIIGNNIKSQRVKSGMSQDNLSKRLGLSRSSLSNIEQGRHQIPLIVLYELSSILSMDLYDLIPTYKMVEDVINSYSNKREIKLKENLNEEEYQYLLTKIEKIRNDDKED